MAKALFVFFKKQAPENLQHNLNLICKSLEPDNIKSRNPFLYVEGNTGYGIINPPIDLLQKEGSFLLGKIFDKYPKWYVPQSENPDGTFALFRSNNDYIEISTDVLATRTIWYYFDEEKIVASTSQRAIIMFLGSFSFNSSVIPWIISSGTLGYSNSWDNRFKKLEADTTLTLKKSNWEIQISQNEIIFETKKDPKKEYVQELQEVLDSSFKDLNFSFKDWSLPLSGGYDSRLILLLLKKNYDSFNELKTMTWGLSSSREKKGTDGYVARKLAVEVGVKNQYLQTDFLENDVEMVFERFFKIGEGRIDHISAYLDGFELWAEIYNEKIGGILRGDEGFTRASLGYFPRKEKIRKAYNCLFVSDFSNLVDFATDDNFLQKLPKALEKGMEESLTDYRDRFYQQYRVSTVLSSLSDLKLSFLEISNPLISKTIISKIRSLPPNLRTGKKLIKNIVNKISPDIEFAKYDSTGNENKVFHNKEAVDLFFRELDTTEAKELFSTSFLNFILNNVSSSSTNQINELRSKSFKKRLIKKLPLAIKETLKSFFKTTKLDVNQLAFRVYMVIKMKKILTEDSKKFKAN